MIQFPETARTEWETVADALHAGAELHKKIQLASRVEFEVDRLRLRHLANLAFQQELEGENTPVLEMTTLTDYKSNPATAPKDLIDGVMKAEGLLIVSGPSGSGKSTLALTMFHSLLTGDDWLGQPVTKIDGSVGVVSYDMDASMMMDWMSGFPNIDTDKVSVVNAHKRGNPLALPDMRQQIATVWKNMNVEVVLIDSFSASFFGNDQNDAAATMAHYRELLSFSREVGAKALIVIAHSTSSNPGKIRGSSVHQDVADSIVSVSGQGDDPRRVEMTKYREAIGQQMMAPVLIAAPDAVTHLVGLDLGAMTMEGMNLPASAAAMAFSVESEVINTPDISTDSDSEEGDDFL